MKQRVGYSARTSVWRSVAGISCIGFVLCAAACTGTAKLAASTTAPVTSTPVALSTPAQPSSSASSSQSPTANEFLSPSGNISCEIDSGGGLPTSAYCQTRSPAQSVTLSPSGSVKVCVGDACVGDPAEDAVTAPYGSAVDAGGFHCTSASSGMSCTISGRGFEISRTAIAPIGAPVLELGAGTYHGTVGNIDAAGASMVYTIASAGCGGAPSSGTWTVNLKNAVFVANSQPATAQGENVNVSESQWATEVKTYTSWDVVVASGQPVEITDGPTNC